jgi:hypothetical protein
VIFEILEFIVMCGLIIGLVDAVVRIARGSE